MSTTSVWARTRATPPVRDLPGASDLSPEWRAATLILRAGFPADETVWDRVAPGRRLDLYDVIRDRTRPMGDRVLLACAQGFIDGATVVPVAYLAQLDDTRLRMVLDALAVARGSLPID